MGGQPTDGAEIQIELGSPEGKQSDEKRRPDRDRRLAAILCGQSEVEGTPVFIHDRALRGIQEHARSDTSVETGGALLGGLHRDGGRQFVEVTDFVPATSVQQSSAQITFTHDTWAEIEAERERRAPDALIVGWYHTHPDLGVFLSDADRFIQEHFFKEPWQVALVLDPVRGDFGLFQTREGGLARARGFHIVGSRGRRRELQEYVAQMEEANRRRTTVAAAGGRSGGGSGANNVWLALLTVAFLSVLVAEGRLGRPLLSPVHPSLESRAALSARMGDYEQAERLYAEAVLRRPKDRMLVQMFSATRRKAEQLPDVPLARQRRFIRWFLSEVDALAGRGDYGTAEMLYAAAGVRIASSPSSTEAWIVRDAEILAAYRYLAEQTRLSKSKPGEPAEGSFGRMRTDIQPSWDRAAVSRMRSGLRRLIAQHPHNKAELEQALKLLDKEYELRSKGIRK